MKKNYTPFSKLNFIILCCILLSNICVVSAQKEGVFPKKPFQHFALESYFSIVPDKYLNSSGIDLLHLEHTLNFSALTNINAHWQIGLHYNYIWTKYDKQLVDNFFIAGIISRYNYGLSKRVILYAEPGINLGNYCFCLNDIRASEELPFKRDNMVYFSIGAGVMIKLYKNLSLRLGLAAYRWLNKPKEIYFGGINLPALGLSLNFGQ